MKFIWKKFRKTETAKTVGRLMPVDLPLLGIDGLTAKVDTGAYNGALHANRIREITDRQGVKRLRFAALGDHKRTTEVANYHVRQVKSSNGLATKRYAIDTKIGLAGRDYPITLTLTNRQPMRHPMLIGRKFLRRHGFLVDVKRRKQ